MKKIFYLFSVMFLLNGCVESVALLGSTVGGASSGKIVQSSINSVTSYGIKKYTGKTPLGHALAYAEKHNPDKKLETCISFIEKTRSEFCTIVKEQASLTHQIIKKKLTSTVKKNSKNMGSVTVKAVINPKNKVTLTNSNLIDRFKQSTKSPRQLAIAFQNELKKKNKYFKNYLVSR
ncbi:hypothetical protein N9J69_02555 [Pelagibacteraceae bacterium]|nr:hypothetical protein [Pelagibacteraceae bacterium]MDB9743512.1 hypothetical protein [Pelagibacteraceae bacterium]MDC0340210.1 hypothetical protein [Pelagibacteraceae bacterium]|tara:strand:- start:163 stop:693 length:531 start_codon:yes stop_codon:yes gene_type:complete